MAGVLTLASLTYLDESLSPLRWISTLRAKSDPDFENVRQDSRFREFIGESASNQ